MFDAAKIDFASERISDTETLATIRDVYGWSGIPNPKDYVLDSHSAVGVTAEIRSTKSMPSVNCAVLLTAHPAKFSRALEAALGQKTDFQCNEILPSQLLGLDRFLRRMKCVQRSNGLNGIQNIVVDEVRLQNSKSTPEKRE